MKRNNLSAGLMGLLAFGLVSAAQTPSSSLETVRAKQEVPAFPAPLPDADAPRDRLTFPQKRGATYDDIRREQTLGKFVVSPDGSFFMYEWSQPYNWVPDNKGLSKSAAARKQTFLYKVLTPSWWDYTIEPTSKHIFPAEPGATYYLGSIAPDMKHVSFYQFDRDDNSLKAGVVEITGVGEDKVGVAVQDTVTPLITWFDARPDDAKLEGGPVWLDNHQIAYPTKKGWVSARISEKMSETGKSTHDTLKAVPCSNCARPAPNQSGTTAAAAVTFAKISGGAKRDPQASESSNQSTEIAADAKVIAQSPNADLLVFSLDTKDTLNLYFKKKDKTLQILENDRRPQKVVLAQLRAELEKKLAKESVP